MGAMYYMGSREGKAKSSGNSFYVLLILRKNRFKSYEVSQCFVDEILYKYANSLGFALGTPISATVDIDGQVIDIKPDLSFVPLNLDQTQSNTPVHYAVNTSKKGG